MITWILTVTIYMHNPAAKDPADSFSQLPEPQKFRMKNQTECRLMEKQMYGNIEKLSNGSHIVMIPECKAVKEYLVNNGKKDLHSVPDSVIIKQLPRSSL